VAYAGSERVLEQLLVLYPQADLFSLIDFLPASDRGFLAGREPMTTFIQRLPLARRRYRAYLPLMPLAIESLDVSGYDLVLSSSHAVAKGVLTGPDQLHVSYVHSPMRYAWDLQHQYLRGAGLHRGLRAWMARRMLHRMRLWDVRTANGVDHFIANSEYIARRIWKVYRREASVVYPPVAVEAISENLGEREDFYLAAGRMVPYKHMDLIAKAFAGGRRRLVVIGDGPQRASLEALAGDNVQVLGYQDDAVLFDYMRRARALIYAAEEDFGILAVEAQACGTPVVAYGRGGLIETVVSPDHAAPTGIFFYEHTPAAINAALDVFEAQRTAFDPRACRANAQRFSGERFRTEMEAVVDGVFTDPRGFTHRGRA
jgi:glycosyltransferase involved in cell wall biosynthesis